MTGSTELQAANHVIDPPSGIVRRWSWYLGERFPVVAHGLLILSFYSSNQFLAHTVCYYTMTPDEHFVVDRHPEHPQVAFAAGLSGHGFKFTPVLGRILCDLVLNGSTDAPIESLRYDRPALTHNRKAS